MARLDLTLLRRFGLAALRGIGAAGVELAAGRRVGRGRDGALQHHALALDSRVRDGNGREQRLGVGVQRVGKNVVGLAVLHQIAQVHNADSVGDMLDDGQIVGDEKIRQVALFLQGFQQVDDLRLNGDVQRGDRLVADDELGVQGQRTGNADTLALAAGELVRIAGLVVGLQAAVVHDLVNIVIELVLRHKVVLAHGLADDLADGQTRGQAGERVLEDDLHLGAQLTHLGGGPNESGVIIPVANAVREILSENAQQTKALKSFSTDLAIELNQGFDETLSRQMQQKILPLMESVDATTKTVVEHIDQMAKTVSSPASDMMQRVVDELKQSMKLLMNEFSSGLSGSATTELENLAHQLGSATQAMADFPKNMENISATLQVTIEEVKHSISEISNTSANTNSMAMRQMQEQITFATGAISNAINEVKEVMSGISQSSQEQSNQMVSKLADAADKMGTFLTGTISTLSSSVTESVKSITDDVNSKQANLIALQEDTTSQTKRLLDSFNIGLERLEKMNEYISGTMNGFRQAQGEITISTSNLRTISGDMKLATELFNKGQNDYATRLAELQTMSQRGIDQVTEMLRDSGQLSEDYVQKFEIIKQGLGTIFTQLQNGLSEYSRTIKESTDKYLAQYTTSLTQTTGALASAIERQNEVTEMLTDTITRNKR